MLIAEVSLFDLAVAFQRLMDEVGVDQAREIVYDDVPVEVHMDGIMTRLEARDRVPFVELFERRPDRHIVAGVFVALLELIKQRRVRAVQERPFAPIEVEKRTDVEPVEDAPEA